MTPKRFGGVLSVRSLPAKSKVEPSASAEFDDQATTKGPTLHRGLRQAGRYIEFAFEYEHRAFMTMEVENLVDGEAIGSSGRDFWFNTAQVRARPRHSRVMIAYATRLYRVAQFGHKHICTAPH